LPPGGIPPPPAPAGFSQNSAFTPAPPWSAPGGQPSDSAGAQLGSPNVTPPADAEARLGPPQFSDPAARPPIISEQPQKKPAAAESPPGKLPPPPLPVGIPQFAVARDRVAAGLRPMLDDGLDWLQASGYRTVLHVRRLGEENSTDRKQVEKRGLKYVTLEVSPQGLSKEAVAEFSRVVGDAAGYPLFVYDRDGALAGALWYLHFRTAEGMSDEGARLRAAGLGLREDREGLHRDMWQAARKLLGEQP
jgi:protein tyrosine phosphatase (PTP) superfamily phosphohydrolase (DUF442 family)